MKLMLTSCGLETAKIEEHFLKMLDKAPSDTKALFIPTAAIDADAVGVLPKCMDDLLKCGISKDKIRVFDLHRNLSADEMSGFDVVYLCGGNTVYLLDRINDSGFRNTLLSYIQNDGFVLGVSAGSLIFADNLPGNLGLLNIHLEVHCERSSAVGCISLSQAETIRLSNTAAMLIRRIPSDVEIVDG